MSARIDNPTVVGTRADSHHMWNMGAAGVGAAVAGRNIGADWPARSSNARLLDPLFAASLIFHL